MINSYPFDQNSIQINAEKFRLNPPLRDSRSAFRYKIEIGNKQLIPNTDRAAVGADFYQINNI